MKEPQTSRAKPAYPIESVDNALRVLLMFREGRRVRLADASRELDVGRSTAHRLMAMLVYHGFAEQDAESKAYVPGPMLVDLGLSVIRGVDIRTIARPQMEALVRELDETVHLVELQGRDIVAIECVETRQALRVGARIGMTLPAYATAAGKALLAQLSQEGLRRLYPSERLPRVTPRTGTSRKALEAELEEIRARGYAMNFGGSEPDVNAVGVAVRDGQGRAQGALTVSVPASRLTERGVPRIATAAMQAAERIGASLG